MNQCVMPSALWLLCVILCWSAYGSVRAANTHGRGMPLANRKTSMIVGQMINGMFATVYASFFTWMSA